MNKHVFKHKLYLGLKCAKCGKMLYELFLSVYKSGYNFDLNSHDVLNILNKEVPCISNDEFFIKDIIE